MPFALAVRIERSVRADMRGRPSRLPSLRALASPAAEPIHRPGHHDIKLSPGRRCAKLVEGGALVSALGARDALVDVLGHHMPPGLGGNVPELGKLILRGLPIAGRDAGVDGSLPMRFRHSSRLHQKHSFTAPLNGTDKRAVFWAWIVGITEGVSAPPWPDSHRAYCTISGLPTQRAPRSPGAASQADGTPQIQDGASASPSGTPRSLSGTYPAGDASQASPRSSTERPSSASTGSP